MENRIIKKRPLLTRSRSRLVRKTKKAKAAGFPAAIALVLGLEGHDGKRLAQRRQHLQDRIQLGVSVSALYLAINALDAGRRVLHRPSFRG